MSKYLEFKEISFKGKTKRFDVVSKTSFEECKECEGQRGKFIKGKYLECKVCDNSGVIPLILGRIQWYSKWRQYVLMPGYPTIWNRDCMNDIIFFIDNLMKDRQIKMGTYKGYVSEKEKS